MCAVTATLQAERPGEPLTSGGKDLDIVDVSRFPRLAADSVIETEMGSEIPRDADLHDHCDEANAIRATSNPTARARVPIGVKARARNRRPKPASTQARIARGASTASHSR